MINTFLFCDSIAMVVLMRKRAGVDTWSPGPSRIRGLYYMLTGLSLPANVFGRVKVDRRAHSAPYLADSGTV